MSNDNNNFNGSVQYDPSVPALSLHETIWPNDSRPREDQILTKDEIINFIRKNFSKPKKYAEMIRVMRQVHQETLYQNNEVKSGIHTTICASLFKEMFRAPKLHSTLEAARNEMIRAAVIAANEMKPDNADAIPIDVLKKHVVKMLRRCKSWWPPFSLWGNNRAIQLTINSILVDKNNKTDILMYISHYLENTNNTIDIKALNIINSFIIDVIKQEKLEIISFEKPDVVASCRAVRGIKQEYDKLSSFRKFWTRKSYRKKMSDAIKGDLVEKIQGIFKIIEVNNTPQNLADLYCSIQKAPSTSNFDVMSKLDDFMSSSADTPEDEESKIHSALCAFYFMSVATQKAVFEETVSTENGVDLSSIAGVSARDVDLLRSHSLILYRLLIYCGNSQVHADAVTYATQSSEQFLTISTRV